MEQNWTAVRSLDYLFGEEMATQLGRTLQKRLAGRNDRKQQALRSAAKLAEYRTEALEPQWDASRLKEVHQRSAEEVRAYLEQAGDSILQPDPREALVENLPMIVSPSSCVTSFGPYNNWGDREGGGIGEVTLVLGPHARQLGGRCIFGGAGSGHVWGGSGCWFRASATGPARLNATFFTNGRAALEATLGYAHTHVRFFGSVWGAAENRWVDRGGFGTDLINAYMWGFALWELEETRVRGTFDAIAGGWYYCAGGFQMWTGVGGFASGGARMLTLLNPLEVCQP